MIKNHKLGNYAFDLGNVLVDLGAVRRSKIFLLQIFTANSSVERPILIRASQICINFHSTVLCMF